MHRKHERPSGCSHPQAGFVLSSSSARTRTTAGPVAQKGDAALRIVPSTGGQQQLPNPCDHQRTAINHSSPPWGLFILLTLGKKLTNHPLTDRVQPTQKFKLGNHRPLLGDPVSKQDSQLTKQDESVLIMRFRDVLFTKKKGAGAIKKPDAQVIELVDTRKKPTTET